MNKVYLIHQVSKSTICGDSDVVIMAFSSYDGAMHCLTEHCLQSSDSLFVYYVQPLVLFEE